MKKANFFFGMCFIWALCCGIVFYANPVFANDGHVITDMCDRKVEVPVNPQRIACMHCVSPEKIMTLGQGHLISVMAEQSPWAYKLFPEIKNAQNSKGITPEQMRRMKIDVVLYTPGMTKEEPYGKAGLKTVCAFSAEARPMKLTEYRDNFKRQIRLFGELLGPDAKARADRYNRYFDKKIDQILAVTSKIDKKNRPAVYYGGLKRSLLGSQGKGSVMHWNVEVAGGNYLPQAIHDNHAKATLKAVQSWDPDIVLLSGYAKSSDSVMKAPELASLKAVKNGRVYCLPQGVYAWDHASNEGVLLMIYMAKLFHPDLFKGWDMIEEMKTFYSEIYGRTITDEDAQRILKNLPPV
ncbi:MAG: ABC transporter substrate-binding protein [Syntrophales bacterium]|jgi:iron complex transport system substrate-binding protein|nr:ABC transporter substrate-binding protein [Syntrophales bacterium]